MITYRYSSDGLRPDQVEGFFVDWPSKPSPETHLRLLRKSDEIVLAVDDQADRVVGFITAITDRVLSAYIPLLEVLPEYQGRGIGTELVRRIFGRLDGLYMVDVMCDEGMLPFYKRLGMHPAVGAVVRNYQWQAGVGDGGI